MSAPKDPFAAGPVTTIDTGSGGGAWVPPPSSLPFPPPAPPPRRGRSSLFWYGGAAVAVLVTGLIVVLVLALNGQLGSGHGPFSDQAQAPDAGAPPLARLCPPPSGAAAPPAGDATRPSGPRTVDKKAGISYRAYGAPWMTWPFTDWHQGTLQVPFDTGQYFVTETYQGGDYLASILSAAVPATVNDSTAIDVECTGHQVAADVRSSYYPQPTTMDVMREGKTTLGGLPAWVSVFRLHFHDIGLKATDELVGVALIDVGRPTAAVLYISIPGTHRQWDHVVDEVLDSVRPV
jgi:hypothetical protein